MQYADGWRALRKNLSLFSHSAFTEVGMDELDRGRSPRVGQGLARWIWITVLSLLILGAVGLWAWKSVQRDRSLEKRKTGMLLQSLPDGDRCYFGIEVSAVDASRGSTT
jgi:hypothetical protein